LILIVLAALSWAAVFGFCIIAGGGFPILALVFSAPMAARAADLLLVAMFALTVLVGLIQAATDKSPRGSPFLGVMTLMSAGLGLLAFTHEVLIIWRAVEITHTHNLRVVAPSLAEACLPLAVGFTVAAVAQALNGLVRAQAKA
jgi:hypothetical protein